MAHIHLLKPRQVTTLPVGFHSDGSNLYLRVAGPNSRQWVFRYSRAGKVRQLGLGSTVDRSITDARDLAQKMREAVRDGLDPAALLNARDPDKMTFRAYAEELMAAKRKEFSSQKWGKQWSATLGQYVYPGIGDMRVREIALGHIEDILRPIWNAKTETANRVRSRIAAILDYAYVAESIDKRNPAAFRGNLEHRGFGKPRKISPVEHFPAAPFAAVPAIMVDLRELSSTTAYCLRFTILTWARSGEARGARWQEFDLDKALWSIPARRMKAKRPHTVPLCDEAVEIVTAMKERRREGAELVFAGERGGLLSDVGINKVLHGLPSVAPLDDAATATLRANATTKAEREATAHGATVHGFRSTARSWAAAKTNFPPFVPELALAHENKDKVESAYQRDTVLDKRRQLMTAWGRYCQNSNVVQFGPRATA